MRRVWLATALVFGLWGVSGASAQVKDCEELRMEIAAKLDAKGVKNYTLEVVDTANVGDATVVGSCGGGTKRITYKKN